MGKYQAGDKVVIRKDLNPRHYYGSLTWSKKKEFMKKLDYVEIVSVDIDGDYLVLAGNDKTWFITNEMISHIYEDNVKYVWMTDEINHSEDGYIFGISKDCSIYSHKLTSEWYQNTLAGVYPNKLLTESEAKKHPLYKAMKRIEVKVDMYYIRIKGYSDKYLSKFNNGSGFMMGSHILASNCKTQFTKEECDELIGNSPVLYKELVK